MKVVGEMDFHHKKWLSSVLTFLTISGDCVTPTVMEIVLSPYKIGDVNISSNSKLFNSEHADGFVLLNKVPDKLTVCALVWLFGMFHALAT